MLHMWHLSGPPLSTIPLWILVCFPGYLPPAYCLMPSSWNYWEWPFIMLFTKGMTDINQWIGQAASSRFCLQTCPCLQVSLCPTKARSTHGHLGLWQAWPKSTMSMWHRTSANPLTPLAQRRHCCTAPGPKTAASEQVPWSEWPGPRSSDCGLFAQRSLWSLFIYTRLLHLYLKTVSSKHYSGLFQCLLSLRRCKSRIWLVSNWCRSTVDDTAMLILGSKCKTVTWQHVLLIRLFLLNN